MIHHLRLVGYPMKLHIGWQEGTFFLQNLIYLLAEANDIISRHHLHIDEQTRGALAVFIMLNILVRLLIPPFDFGNIAQPHHLPFRGVGKHNLLPNLVFRAVRNSYLHERISEHPGRLFDFATHRSEALQSELRENGFLINAHSRKPVRINRHSHLFLLLPLDTHLAQFRDGTQAVGYLKRILLKLARRTGSRLDSHQNGGGATEIIHHHNRQTACRQGGLLKQIEPMPNAAPSIVLVGFHVQIHIHIHDAVLRHRIRALFVDFLKRKQVTLQRLGHLRLHFLSRSPRIDSCHHALTNRELRKLILVHQRKRHQAEQHQRAHHESHQTVLPDCFCNMVAFAFAHAAECLK